MLTLSMTACNRPAYTRRVLDALARCEGLGDFRLLAFVEPVNSDVVSLFHGRWEVTVNPHRFGCNRNTLQALASGLESEFHVHIEDDTVPAPDALAFLRHAWQAKRDDMDVISVTANTPVSDYSRPFGWGTRRWFTPWVWGSGGDKLKAITVAIASDLDGHASWDTITNQETDGWEAAPCVARSLNIGSVGGVHVPSPDWHQMHHYNPDWGGAATGWPRGNWVEVELPAEPDWFRSAVRRHIPQNVIASWRRKTPGPVRASSGFTDTVFCRRRVYCKRCAIPEERARLAAKFGAFACPERRF